MVHIVNLFRLKMVYTSLYKSLFEFDIKLIWAWILKCIKYLIILQTIEIINFFVRLFEEDTFHETKDYQIKVDVSEVQGRFVISTCVKDSI